MDRSLRRIVSVGAAFAATHAIAEDATSSMASYGPLVNAVTTFIAWVVGAAVVWGTAKSKIDAAEKTAAKAEMDVSELSHKLNRTTERLTYIEGLMKGKGLGDSR